jgi:hypothetical protein
MENNAECRQMILGLYEGIPELDIHAFKPWSDEIRERVHAYLGDLTGNPGKSFASTTNYSKVETPVASAPATPQPKNETPMDLGQASNQAATSSDGDIEDWLKEFDMK